MGEGVARDPPDRGVGPGLLRGPGGGGGCPPTSPRRREGRISVSPKVLVAGCHFFQQVGNVVRSARHVAGLDAACWLGGCWGPRPGLLLSLAAAPASRVAARRGPGKALRHDVRDPDRRGCGCLSRGAGAGRETGGDGLTTGLLAERRAHGRRDRRLGLAGKPDTRDRAVSLPRARGQSPPPSRGGRGRPTRGAAGGGVGGHRGGPERSAQAPLRETLPLVASDVSLRADRLSGGNDNASRAWSRETLERRLKDGPGRSRPECSSSSLRALPRRTLRG